MYRLRNMEETLKQRILNKTDNGLQISKDLYPNLTEEKGMEP